MFKIVQTMYFRNYIEENAIEYTYESKYSKNVCTVRKKIY